MAHRIKILAVGKLKTPHWKEAFAHYAKRLQPHVQLEEAVVKDAPGSLSPPERNRVEGAALLTSLTPKDRLLCLDQGGRALDSPGLAKLLGQLLDEANTQPCFVIGGAFGLAPAVLAQSRQTLSLGPLTLPHELARVVLAEQLFRALTILKGLPYHH